MKETPQLNETWQVQWQQGGTGKEYNILVRINEDKKEFNPPNWRRNDFECEYKNERIVVSGNNFIERWADAETTMMPCINDRLNELK